MGDAAHPFLYRLLFTVNRVTRLILITSNKVMSVPFLQAMQFYQPRICRAVAMAPRPPARFPNPGGTIYSSMWCST